MKHVARFEFCGVGMRVIVRDNGQEEWIARDAMDCLGLTNATEALRSLDRDEKGKVTFLHGEAEHVSSHGDQISAETNTESRANTRTYTTVTEAGLYKLILKSQKPTAKAFTRFLCHEMLPQIRRHGYYVRQGDEARVAAELQQQLAATQAELTNSKAAIISPRRGPRRLGRGGASSSMAPKLKVA